MTEATLSVVIPTWNGKERARRCVDDLLAQTRPPSEIIVVDDGSDDGTVDLFVERYPQLTVVAMTENRGFCAAVNVGIGEARGDYIMLLNNDMTMAPDCLEHLYAALEPKTVAGPLVLFESKRKTVYAAGDRLLPNGRPESIGFREHLSQAAKHLREPTGITAGAAIYPRALFEEAGLFDETFVAYFDDMDMSLRARWLGYTMRIVPRARAFHEGAASLEDRRWWRTRQCQRNHLLLVLKHFPLRLLLRHLPAILVEHARARFRTLGAVRCDRGLVRAIGEVMKAEAEGLSNLPHALRERRRIRSTAVLKPKAFSEWLWRGDGG